MLGYVSTSLRSFARRNFNFMSGNSREEEENAARPRNAVYSMFERVFGQYIPLALYTFIIGSLITGAIVTTAAYGGSHSNDSLRNRTPAPVDTRTADNRSAPITSSHPLEITFLFIFCMMAFTFYLLSLVVANRIWRRLFTASTTRISPLNAPLSGSNAGRLNQILARLVQTGRAGDATALRSRLRLAMINRDFDGNDYEMLQSLDDQNPHAGATEGEINRLPVHVLTLANIENGQSECSKNCSICLAPYEVGDSVKTVICLHQFHVDCIDTWLRTHASCPLCNHFATG